jgi:hypothetical protein
MLSSAATFSFFLAIGSVRTFQPIIDILLSANAGHSERCRCSTTDPSSPDATPLTSNVVTSRRLKLDEGNLGG